MSGGKKKDEFDILTFFIYVMITLTVIVGGFALVNWMKVREQRKQITFELNDLDKMKKVAADSGLHEMIIKERDNQAKAGGGKSFTVEQFRKLYINRARLNKLKLFSHSQGRAVDHRGTVELPFTLQLRDCKVEQLTKYLVGIEEDWPGARVKRITKLRYSERRDGTRGWDAVVIVSIYRAKGAPGS